MIKRVLRFYINKPNYLNPKEITKIFSLFDERHEVKKKNPKDTFKIAELEEEIRLVMKVVLLSSPDAYWNVSTYRESGVEFDAILITEEVSDSLFDKGQDQS